MSATELHPQGKTRITKAQFDELYNCGRAPFDTQQEVGRLGVAFNGESKGQVKIWWVEGAGHFLETPGTIEEARQILALK